MLSRIQTCVRECVDTSFLYWNHKVMLEVYFAHIYERKNEEAERIHVSLFCDEIIESFSTPGT